MFLNVQIGPNQILGQNLIIKFLLEIKITGMYFFNTVVNLEF